MYPLPTYVWAMILTGVLGIPAVTCAVLYRGGIAVGLGRRAAGRIAATASIGWAAWVLVSGLLAGAGAYRQDPSVLRPWLAVALFGAFAAVLLCTRIPVVARILADPGTVARLALPQTLRVVGVAFLVALALGALPAVFALPAGLGDLAVGIAAPLAARQGGTVSFNILGIVDLVVAVGIGFLAGLGPTQLLATTPSTAAIALLPLVLVPTTAVPLAAALHAVSLAKLRAPQRHPSLDR